ncbi:unnamed protein product [Nezara viridula]|uniref:Uncharacterized protein n=1 Tax=Nezara viridula TaxID=85310 RepID=A0A9P0E8H3_NEZVI|nr:unnamed protein product [Nezara viridula]
METKGSSAAARHVSPHVSNGIDYGAEGEYTRRPPPLRLPLRRPPTPAPVSSPPRPSACRSFSGRSSVCQGCGWS